MCLPEVCFVVFSLLSQMMIWHWCDPQGAGALGEKPSIIINLLRWFKMLHNAQTQCHLAHATQYCFHALVSVKLFIFGLLFSLHVFVFDTGANCKCVLWIDNPGQAQSRQFKIEGNIDRVQRHVLHNTVWGFLFIYLFLLQLHAAPHQCQFIQTPEPLLLTHTLTCCID